MLTKIKAYITAAASVAAVIFYALFQRQKAARAEEKAEREEAVREYQQAGYEALVGGLKNEERAKNEKVNTARRDHFS